MTGYTLSPDDNNYLAPDKVYRNLTQNTVELALDGANCSAVEGQTPTLHLNGQGNAFLTGTLKLTNATPPAGMTLFTLPESVPLLSNFQIYPVTQFNGTTYSTNYLSLFDGSSSIASIAVNTAGNYASIPAVSIIGTGEGFVGTANVKAAVGLISVKGTGYVPGNTWELTGGTPVGGVKFTGIVNHTTVVSATIAAGGTGGTDGTATVEGTTGTVTGGTRFQANVTISGGIITAVNSITVGGVYATNPTSLSAEPVTGAGLTGATLNIVMGAEGVQFTNAGRYSAIPAGPYATTATSGSGTGLTFAIQWGVNDIVVADGGYGYTSANTVDFVGGGEISSAAATITLSSNPPVPTGKLANASTLNNTISLDGINFITGTY